MLKRISTAMSAIAAAAMMTTAIAATTGGAVCPKCGAEFELDLDALENGDIITCPECGAELNFEYVDDEDETEE